MGTREELIQAVKQKRAAEPGQTREQLIQAVKEKRVQETEAQVTPGEQAQTFIEEFGQSASFGLLPQLQAGTEVGIEAVLGAIGREDLTEDTEFAERVRRNVERIQQQRQRAPGAALAGGIAGALGGGGLIGGAARAARALPVIGRGVQAVEAATRVPGIAGRAAQVGAGAVTGAAAGALETPLPTEEQLAAGEIIPFAPEQRLEQAQLGALAGGGLPAVIGAVSGVAKALAPKKIISATLGVKERVIDKFLDSSEDVKKVESEFGFEGVRDMIARRVDEIKKAFLDAKIGRQEAENAVKNAEIQMRQTLVGRDKELLRAFNISKDRLNTAFSQAKSDLKAVPSPTDLRQDIVESVRSLKNLAVEGSADATDQLLKDIPDGIAVTKDIRATLFNALEKEIDKVSFKGEAASNISAKAIDQINVIKNRLGKILGSPFEEAAAIGAPPKILGAQDVKRFIQNLDQEIAFLDQAGDFMDVTSRARLNLRQEFDNILKTLSPNYREKMLDVAGDFQLLARAKQFYGTPDRAMIALSNISARSNQEKLETLQALGLRTENDFGTRLGEFLEVRKTLDGLTSPQLKKAFRESLDEFDDFEAAKGKLAEFRQRGAEEIENQVQLAEKRTAVENRKVLELDRQSVFDQFKTLQGDQIESKMRKLMAVFNSGDNRAIVLRRQMQALSDMSDTNFTKAIDNLATGDAFTKEFLRGSRNVNLWTVMGLAFSNLGRAAAGGGGGFILGGPVGAAVGAGIGGMIDIYGPRVARKILEQVVRIKGIPTVQQIQRLDLPDQVKRDLVEQFRNTIIKGTVQDQKIDISAEQRPVVSRQIRERSDLSSSEVAKLLSELNETGRISLDQFMGSDIDIIDKSKSVTTEDVKRATRELRNVK